MTDPASPRYSSYPLAPLRDLADAGTMEIILQGAARLLPRTGRPIREAMRQEWRSQIHGFRDPLKAPPAKLARELEQFLFRFEPLTHDLVGLWVESVDGLKESIDGLIETADQDERLTRLLEMSTKEWSASDLPDLADAHRERFPGLGQHAIAIMLGDRLWEETGKRELVDDESDDEDLDAADDDRSADVAAEAPGAVEGTETPRSPDELLADIEEILRPLPQAPRAPRFSRLIDELDALPWDAPEWDQLPELIGVLIRSRNRAAERARASCAHLAERLGQLGERYPRAFRFSEYRAPVPGPDLVIRPADLTSLHPLCDSLEDALSRLEAALQNLPTRSSVKDWNALTDGLAEDIHGLLAEIETVVGGARPREREAGTPTSEDRPETTDAAPGTATEIEPVAAPATEDLPPSPPEARPPAVDATVAIARPEAEAEPDRVAEVEVTWPGSVETPEVAPVPAVAAEPVMAIAPAAAPGPVPVVPIGDGRADFLCTLVGDGDLAGGYWLARALADTGISLPFPDWLLAAAQATPWLANDSDAFVPELLDLASSRQPAGVAQHLLALSVRKSTIRRCGRPSTTRSSRRT